MRRTNVSCVRRVEGMRFVTIGLALLGLAVMTGCAADLPWGGQTAAQSYSTRPKHGSGPRALLRADELTRWIDQGYVDDDGHRVVILVSGETAGVGHIVGALPGIDKENRSNGIGVIQGMVLSGPTMDAALQARGIDEETTVVFTGTDHPTRMRAWWTFRYWGFHRARLKVLDGTPERVMPPAYLTTAATPAPTPSTYSVRYNHVNTDIIATLDDVLDFATLPDQSGFAVLDVRTPGEYAGTNTMGNVFGGHVRGASLIPYTDWLDADGKFISKDAMLASLASPRAGKAISASDILYVHCQTATRSGTMMFAFLEILGWQNVKNWDGAWVEWGNLVETADLHAPLAASVSSNVYLQSSEWNVTAANTDSLQWNTTLITRPIRVTNSSAPRADAFIVEDVAYTVNRAD